MTVKVRFAPSPTGFIHVGNARVALINWLFARNAGGRFLLRLDDTDAGRSTAEFAAAIEDDMTWLGLTWDDFARQSERLDRYEAGAATLRAKGRLYACYETPDELEQKRKLQLARHKPPIYDRAALDLGEGDKAELEAEGRKPHWRFRLDREEVAWQDLVRGAVHFDASSLSDPVLMRADGRPLYTLSSVVDDIDMAISHVLRGEDHVANTAVQIQVFAALGADAPEFGHFALLVGGGGEGLSKRFGSLSLRNLRDEGIEPEAVNSLLAKLGTSDPVVARQDLGAIAENFDIAHFGRAPAHFDIAELKGLNAKVLHGMTFPNAYRRLAELGLKGADEGFWNAVRPNLETMADARDWWRIVTADIEPGTGPGMGDGAFLAEAAALLPAAPWDESSWSVWTKAVAAATGARGRALFLPLRLALTGLDHGPEMRNLLPLIGPERARSRLPRI